MNAAIANNKMQPSPACILLEQVKYPKYPCIGLDSSLYNGMCACLCARRCICSPRNRVAVYRLYISMRFVSAILPNAAVHSKIMLQLKFPPRSPAPTAPAQVSLKIRTNKKGRKFGELCNLKGCLDGFVSWQVVGYEKVGADHISATSAWLS